MNSSCQVVIEKNSAGPAVELLLEKCSPRRLAAAIARPLAQFWRERLISLGANKQGWPPTHFWPRAARSLTVETTDSGVSLTVNQTGVRQRWLGGRISAVKAGALTIPISPLSYGKTAADFPGLVAIQTKKGGYLVQPAHSSSEKSGSRRGRKRGGGRLEPQGPPLFLFRLVKTVWQEANKDVVPKPEEFSQVATSAINDSLK